MECPVDRAMDVISKKWNVIILLELYKGNEWKRYSEIKKKIKNITPKSFSTRLKQLQEEKLIENRTDTTIKPVKSEYSLTKKGKDFIKIIDHIKTWSLQWNPDVECSSVENCKNCTR